ncbi:MAG: PQQ-binding-like beta-propeller repeat protein [Pirellulales bacterium]
MGRRGCGWWAWTAVLLAVLLAEGTSAQAAALVAESQAKRCGLTRGWFAQVGSLQTTGEANHLHYVDGMLLVQTTGGMLSALDAETGRVYWATQVGVRGRQTSEAAANKDHVAVLNGSSLYVLNRADGSVKWHRPVSGGPGAGPAASETHAFVPMVDGQIEGYKFEGGDKGRPWIYKSAGRVLVPPVFSGQTVSWTTDRGYLYAADAEGGGVRFRLETSNAINARPGYWTPNLYAASTDGSVYAVNEASGRMHWKYSVGEAILEQPVAIQDKVFAVSMFRGMTCLGAKDGAELWVAPGITQFLAASPTRLYACDATGQLSVLDLATGTRLGSLPLVDVAVRLTNSHSDRIYLVGATGAVQCLREVAQKTPVLHIPPPPKKEESKARLRDRKGEAPAESPDEPPAEPTEDPDAMPADDAADAPPAEAMDEPAATPDDKADLPDDLKSDDPFATPESQ